MTYLPFDITSGHRLYAGPCPNINPGKFQELDIKTAAVLLSEADKKKILIDAFYSERQIQQICCPIQDMSAPPSTFMVLEFVGKIFKALEQGNVYLHCIGGKGRTGLIVACISILKKGLSGKEAIDFTRTLILGAIETVAQEKFIWQFNKEYGSKQDTTPSPREPVAPPAPPVPLGDFNHYEDMIEALPFVSSSGHKFYISSRPATMPEYLLPSHSEKFKKQMKTVVVLLEDTEGTLAPVKRYYESQAIEPIYFPIPSKEVPSSIEQIRELMQILFQAQEKGDVYLHCNAFQLRTGLLIACMAILKQALTDDEAYALAKRFMLGFMTEAQKAFIQRFYQAYGSKEDFKTPPAPAPRALPHRTFSSHQLYSSAAFQLNDEFSQNALPFESKTGFKLYAGSNLSKSLKNPEKIFKTAAILLTQEEINEANVTAYYNLRAIRQIYFPMPEVKEKGPMPTAEKTLTFIDRIFEALEKGNVYLQCKSGISRTAIILACIAIVKNRMNESDAVAFTERYIPAGIFFPYEKEYVHQFYLDYKKIEESSKGDPK